MKGFIVLLCAVGGSIAAPQYNYARPGSSGGFSSGLGSSGGAGGFGVHGVNGGGHFGSGSVGGGHFGSGSTGGGGSFGSFGGGIGVGSGGFGSGSAGFGGGSGGFGGGSGGFGGGFGGFSGGISGGHGGQTIVTKQFFIHSAPEEQDEVGADKVINLGPGRKHYRVVFIKAPHQGVQAGRVRFQAPANEEKTVIYVLSKKTDVSDIQADVQQAHSEPTKPEVHFIKYKTLEEAAHAQRQIQATYDSLGGSSQISDEGVAPISSVVGALGGSASHGGGSGILSGGFVSGGSIGGGSFGSSGTGLGGFGGSAVGGTAYLPPHP